MVRESGGTRHHPEGADALFARAYEQLRALAAAVQRDPSRTLSPTALVNEVWLKLSNSGEKFQAASTLHFRNVVARAMRQVLVDGARRRSAEKRGGGVTPVTFDDESLGNAVGPEELLDLDDALQTLTRIQPRQAQVVEARFFGGLELKEIAEYLDISEATVLRDWRAARAWLNHELGRER